MYQPWAKANFDRPSGTRSNPKHDTGDKSPAYFLVVPPGHTGTPTALNAENVQTQGTGAPAVFFPYHQ